MLGLKKQKNNNRILIITWNFPPKKGGMENLIYDIYWHLSSKYEIDVIAPYASDNGKYDIYRPKHKGFLYFNLFATYKASILLLNKKHKFVFGGSLAILPILTVLKTIFKAKIIAYAHGLDIIYHSRIYQLIIKLCHPLVDGFICNSQNTKNILVSNLKHTKKVTVIPPGLNMHKYSLGYKRLYPRRYILSVGRLTERKGLIEFIENSYAFIAKNFPDVDFVIVGDEPKEAMYHKTGYKQKLLKSISKHGLQKRVVLYGWAEEDEKLALYEHCECLVFPGVPAASDVEGFGIVAIEAGAMGKPTVAFDVGGVDDAIISGKTGFLFDPNDYFNMTRQIQNILCNDHILANDNCIIEYCTSYFSYDSIINRFVDFLNDFK